jgi:membrane protein implicated in regulation of membrane protease activity
MDSGSLGVSTMLHVIFIAAAILGGTVLVCQFVLTIIGMSGDGGDALDGDVSADVSASGEFTLDGHTFGDHHTPLAHAADADYQHPDSTWLFGVLSFRTVIAAAAFFGIAGEAALNSGYSPGISLAIATLVGVGAMYGMYWLMRGISQLTSSGNERIGAAVGKQAVVYVPIPANEKGLGKIQITLQNRTVELQAASIEDKPLRTGEEVEVVDIRNGDTVTVRRVKVPAAV